MTRLAFLVLRCICRTLDSHANGGDDGHTAATLLLAQRVPARVLMEVLGHSQIGITMNIYSHVRPTQLAQAANAMESALWGEDS